MNTKRPSWFRFPNQPRFFSFALAFLIVATMAGQHLVVAQSEDGTPAADNASQDVQPLPEPTQEQPTEPPVEEIQQVVPPTDVPAPTDIPAPTDVPEPTTTTRPINTDTLSADNVPTGIVLQQGQTQQFDLTYSVTTPRLGTSLTAQIQGADGWLVQLSANGTLSDAGTSVTLTDTSAANAGSAIALTLIVTAPSVVNADQSVTLWLSSTSQDLDGLVVLGIAANGPLVSVGATPPPPMPTIEPTRTPTAEPTATATPDAFTPDAGASTPAVPATPVAPSTPVTPSTPVAAKKTQRLAAASVAETYGTLSCTPDGGQPISQGGNVNYGCVFVVSANAPTFTKLVFSIVSTGDSGSTWDVLIGLGLNNDDTSSLESDQTTGTIPFRVSVKNKSGVTNKSINTTVTVTPFNKKKAAGAVSTTLKTTITAANPDRVDSYLTCETPPATIAPGASIQILCFASKEDPATCSSSNTYKYCSWPIVNFDIVSGTPGWSVKVDNSPVGGMTPVSAVYGAEATGDNGGHRNGKKLGMNVYYPNPYPFYVTITAPNVPDVSGSATLTMHRLKMLSTSASGSYWDNGKYGSTPDINQTFTFTTSGTPLPSAMPCAASPDPVVAGSTLTISCTVPPDNWSRRGGVSGAYPFTPVYGYGLTSGGSGANVPLTNQTFSFTAQIPCTQAAGTFTATVSADLNYYNQVNGSIGYTIAGGQTIPAVGASNATFGTSNWSGSAYPTLATNVTVSLTKPAGCVAPQWKVQTSVSAMTGPGGATITADKITHTGGATTASGVTAAAAQGSLAEGKTVATGTSAMSSGNLTLNFLLSPPDTAPTGNYTGTITFTTSSGN